MTGRFTRLTIENWRAIRQISLVPDADLSWFMGRNGSGKSSLLDAIVMPCDLLRASGDPLSVLDRESRGAPMGEGRWAFRDLLHDASAPARWTFEFIDTDEVHWRYTIALSSQPASPQFQITEELLERHHQGVWSSVLEHGPAGGRWIRGGWPDGAWVPLASRPTSPLLGRADDPTENAAVYGALRFLRGVWLLHPDPVLMREATSLYVDDNPIDRYGRDLTDLLRRIIGEYPKEFSDIIDAGQAVEGWHRLRATRDGVVFEERGGAPLALGLASDGQLLAAWTTALSMFPPDAWTVALIDEPALTYDRDSQDRAFDWLLDLSGHVQVLAATHGERAVDRASRSQVWLVERAHGQGARVTRLDQHPVASKVPGIFKPGDIAAGPLDASDED